MSFILGLLAGFVGAMLGLIAVVAFLLWRAIQEKP